MDTFDNMNVAWHSIGNKLLDGASEDSRVGPMREKIGSSFTLANPRHGLLVNERRAISPEYAAAEVLWYLSGTNDTTFLQKFAPSYSKFTEDGTHAWGAYGHRWDNDDLFQVGQSECGYNSTQVGVICDVLHRSPETRQAVMTCWNARDLPHALKADRNDLPCTLSLQFILRRGHLNLITTMRSNDFWLGLPYDVFAFTTIQRIVAADVGAELGTYTHNVGSMHLYERNVDAFRECKFESTWEVNAEARSYREARCAATAAVRNLSFDSNGLEGELYRVCTGGARQTLAFQAATNAHNRRS